MRRATKSTGSQLMSTKEEGNLEISREERTRRGMKSPRAHVPCVLCPAMTPGLKMRTEMPNDAASVSHFSAVHFDNP